MKFALSLALSLSFTVPAVLTPAYVNAASQKQQAYTKADRAYIKYHSDTLYKIRVQTDDLLKVFQEADKYNEDEFMKIVENKTNAWSKTMEQATNYRPQDIPPKFKKAHSLFIAAVKANLDSMGAFSEDEDVEPEVFIQNFEKKHKIFKQKADAFDQEIKRLNKIYK